MGIIKLPLNIGAYTKIIDQGWSEYFGANNLLINLIILTKFYQVIHFNNIKLYLLRFILWVIFVILILIFYLNSLYKEHDIEAIKEIMFIFE